MSYPESGQACGESCSSTVAAIFTAHKVALPPAEILEEISDKILDTRPGSEVAKIFSAYGVDIMPKRVKDVPFVKLYDVIRQTLSGSGKKTETFCMGILQHLNCSLAECQALILAPTRQLAQQIAEVMKKLGDNFGQVKVHACMGGEKHNLRKDQRILSQGGFHVIVGTPGCLCTILNRKLLRPDHIKMFVLGEADKMLSLGFRNQVILHLQSISVEEIFRFLPSKVQLALFSATFHPEAFKIMRRLMLKPVTLVSKSHEVVAREEGIKRFYVNVPDELELKFATLHHICQTLDFGYCVIYVNTLLNAITLSSEMSSSGYEVSSTCTYMHQEFVDAQVEEFRSGSSNVLITMPDYFKVRATDLRKVSLVINYFIEKPCDSYLRSWHGGRFRRHGVVIDLNTMNEEELADDDDIHGFCDVVVVEGEGLNVI